jgi:hypothetical protein
MTNEFVQAPYKKSYEQEIEIRKMVAGWIERDTAEGMEQYTRLVASLTGDKVFEDWAPSERLAVYIINPPITPDGMPPEDVGPVMSEPVMGPDVPDPATGMMNPGPEIEPAQELQPAVYPQWTALSKEFPSYYIKLCEDANRLLTLWLQGKMEPSPPLIPQAAPEGIPAI